MRILQLSLSVIVAVFAFSPVGFAQDAQVKPDKPFLPFAGAVSTASAGTFAFSVKQTNASGGNAILGKTAGAYQAGVFASGTGNQGYGVYSVSSGPTSIAVQGYNTGTGNAGNFYMDNPNVPDNGFPTSTANTVANAVVYAATNAGSTSTIGYYGPAAAFVINNPQNFSPAVYAQPSPGGYGVYATSAAGGIGLLGQIQSGDPYGFTIAVEGSAFGTAGYAVQFGGGGEGNGVCSFAGGAGWNCTANPGLMKKKSEQVDPERVLRQLAAMPVYYYGIEGARDEAVRYLGPSAEDFKAAFDLGVDDKTINSGNAQGVAFAAIQGLYRQLQAKDQEIAELRAENKALKSELDARLAAMESRLAGRIALTAQQHTDKLFAGLQ